LDPETSNPTLEDKVRREILAACQRANWKLGGPRGAAARLGLKRTTLFYKMRRLGIAPPPDHSRDWVENPKPPAVSHYSSQLRVGKGPIAV